MDEDKGVQQTRELALKAAGKTRHPPAPRKATTFDRRHVAILKGAYISADEAPSVEQMAQELADWSGNPIEKARSYLHRFMQHERWHVRRKQYWEELGERALELSMRNTLENFEQRITRDGLNMVDRATEAMAVLTPKDLTEAILLYKLGMDATLRGFKAPSKLTRYVDGSSAPGEQGRIMEARYQDMSEDDYAAAALAGNAKLARAVGADPAPGRDDG